MRCRWLRPFPADGPATVLAWPEVLLYLLGTYSTVEEAARDFTPQVCMPQRALSWRDRLSLSGGRTCAQPHLGV